MRRKKWCSGWRDANGSRKREGGKEENREESICLVSKVQMTRNDREQLTGQYQ